MKRRFACVYIPNFPLEVFFRAERSLASKPVAVADDAAGSILIVVSNSPARKKGVKPNMTKAQAHFLCPNLLIRIRDREREKKGSYDILTALRNISPSVREQSPGIYFADTSGLTLLYRSEKLLAEKIISTVRAGLFPVKVGIAKNMFLARVAAEVSRDSGFTIVTAGAEDEFLRDMPIDHLAISPEVLEKLNELGIRTIGEVSGFGENEMALRFKAEGARLAVRSKGGDPDLFSPESLPERLSRRIRLTYSIHKAGAVILHIERLLNELIDKASPAGYSVGDVVICLRLEDRTERSFRVKLDKPSVSVDKFVRQIKNELGKHKIASGVNEIKVTIARVLPRVSEQLELLGMGMNTKVLTRENLINIPDFGRLCLPELRSSFLPERNFSLTPASHLKNREADIAGRNEWDHPYAMSMISGLRLFQHPKRVGVILRDSVPRSIVTAGIRRKIEGSLGPWRISGEWWDRGFDRLYYEIETNDRKLYLLYYDRLSSRWFIQGIFD